MCNQQNEQDMNITKRIGDGLRVVRHLRHMTMSEVADRMTSLGDEPVSSRMIGAWERGEAEITGSHLLFLARALECSFNALIVDHSHTETTEELLID